ncbi:lysophospholipid acyltransferase family protein [Maribacter sp. HTCC2170]|uniref:lysophospholipid acyltransferase family protein n=1 Tax=Maribacter sp. (strain HTCC2170 / KCCM 42371) TaxID=313603 RepID=UPI00006BD403|nr:lysophospholipid acyltransferase family protein [Maribacter sp. HTCC2170]EAR02631.1 1-acyl-sn-glycerol-3-phosphate acetyltransferase, putative [Maribacter sp. HTCC2170]
MQKIIAYPLTFLYFLLFGLALAIFHPIQWICFNVFGYNAHRLSVAALNCVLIRCTHVLGTTYKFNNSHKIPADRPLIMVLNHQSMNDIPPIIWFMRKYHPKFVSKIELGKGIPSVSYNLRHGGSVLIDRKDSKQALMQIAKLGKYIEKHDRSAVIFPEGTRSRNGHPKKFQPTGLKILMKNAPSALIVPISINNSWEMLRYGKFPYGLGNRITFDVHPPIENDGDLDAIIALAEEKVVSGINLPK